jgi:hypothetical protein
MPEHDDAVARVNGSDAEDASNELSDEGLEMVVGGLARPWTEIVPIDEEWPPRSPDAADVEF